MLRAFAILLLLAAPALAQTSTTPQQPFLYDAQVTTSPSQIVPSNPNRRSIEFCNPNAAVTVSVCPTMQRRTGAAVTCAVNGRGSITLPPSTCWAKTVPLQQSPLQSSWNGISASGTANITVLETE